MYIHIQELRKFSTIFLLNFLPSRFGINLKKLYLIPDFSAIALFFCQLRKEKTGNKNIKCIQ
jgi:hypothetical protein